MMVASQPASEFCFFCKKRVYIMERTSVENVFFHSQCFKCDFCGVILRTNTYSVDKTSYGDGKCISVQKTGVPTTGLKPMTSCLHIRFSINRAPLAVDMEYYQLVL